LLLLPPFPLLALSPLTPPLPYLLQSPDELIRPQKRQPAPAEVAMATAGSAVAETMLR